MTTLPENIPNLSDVILVKLAREIALDILPLETILKTLQITANQWEIIQTIPRFQDLLRSEIEAWGSAINTSERVRLKSLSFVEEALPEFYARAHDPREPLAAKTEILKTIARFAGVGNTAIDGGMIGEKFTVTINLGSDQTFKIEKDITPTTIEADA